MDRGYKMQNTDNDTFDAMFGGFDQYSQICDILTNLDKLNKLVEDLLKQLPDDNVPSINKLRPIATQVILQGRDYHKLQLDEWRKDLKPKEKSPTLRVLEQYYRDKEA